MVEDVDPVWKRRARMALLFIGLMSVFMGWRVSLIGFNYDFESFFPKDDPETTFYLDFREQFETDNDFPHHRNRASR